MFQAFIVFCAVGAELEPKSCFAITSPVLTQTEEQCYYMLAQEANRLIEVMPETAYIYNAGCHNHIKEDKKSQL